MNKATASINSSDMPSNIQAKESKLIVYLICLYIITWYLQLGLRIEILGSIRFEFILGLFLSLASISKLISERSSTPLKKPILLFLTIIIIYTAFSYDRTQSWNIFYDRVLKFSMLAAFFAAYVRTEWALRMVIYAFLIAMIKLGQEGFLGWISGAMVWQNQGIPRLHGSTPLYRHPNSFSGMAVGCLPFIFYLFPISNRWQKILLLILLSFSIIIIIFTGSRTGYVATGLLGLYFWKEKLKKNKVKYLFIGISIIAISYLILPSEYKGRIQSIYTLEEAEGSSANARIRIIKDSLGVFISHPWGVGVAAFPSVRMEMYGRFQDTHNLYLELLTNMGILGLIAFGSLVVSLIKTNKKTLKNNENNKLITAICSATIAFIYARLFLGFFGMDTYEIYWWFAAGLTMATYRISEQPKSNLANKLPTSKLYNKLTPKSKPT